MPYTGKMLPAITGWWFLAILFVPTIVIFSIAQLLSLEGRKTRKQALSPKKERVLVLGASDGIGKELALQYAQRGASVCLVARTTAKLQAVADQCKELLLASPLREASFDGRHKATFRSEQDVEVKVLVLTADIANVDALLEVREKAEQAWGGLDTIHIVAGVLSTKTFAALSGSSATVHTRETAADSVNKRARSTFGASDKQGVQNVVDLARKALETNYIGALSSYATFLPFLSSSSAYPTIVLLSTVAAVLPTPTRTLYSASKGATHSLLASLALESDILGLGVEFIEVLAGSVNTSLRTRAVDASSSGPTEPESKWSLAPSTVAAKVIETVDKGLGDGTRNETLRLRQVWLPQKPYRWAHLLYWLPGSFLRGQVENGAREKYSAALGL